jgi:hypothetical protein
MKPHGAVKYLCLRRLTGIDRRTQFYGHEGKKYDSSDWKRIGSANVQAENSPDDEKSEKPMSKEIVGADEAKASWMSLSELAPFGNQLWNDLLLGLSIISESALREHDLASVISTYIDQHPLLCEESVVAHVRTVFQRHAFIHLTTASATKSSIST